MGTPGNPYHDPDNGQFTNAPSASGGPNDPPSNVTVSGGVIAAKIASDFIVGRYIGGTLGTLVGSTFGGPAGAFAGAAAGVVAGSAISLGIDSAERYLNLQIQLRNQARNA